MPTIAAMPSGRPAAAAISARSPVGGVAPSAAVAAAAVASVTAAIDVTAAAAVAIGGHRAVCLAADGSVVAASSDDVTCIHCLGLTLGAAAAGASVSVRRLGEIDDPSFAFAVGPVWLGLAGALTQVRPTTGILLQVGFALGPTRLLVHPRPATILAPAS